MAITQEVSPGAEPQAAHGFSTDERAAFARDGYVIARGLVDAALCRQMLDVTHRGLAAHTQPIEYEADLQYPGAPPSRAVAGGDTIRRLKEAYARDPVFTRLFADPAILVRLEQLLGSRVVMPLAHHNCIMTKHPRFSSETHWHQDIRYWSFARPELVSFWLALGDETTENGCLWLIPGTHRMLFTRERLDDALFLRPERPENAALIAQKIPAPLRQGDVLFFHCRTFHAAGRNQTDETKLSVVFTFRPIDNPPIPGTRSASLPELLLPGMP